MLNPLLRFTFLAYVWKRYKRNIVLTLLALGLIAIVSLIHSDYLAYSNETGATNWVGWSFIIKWMVYVVIVGLWLWQLKTARQPKPAPRPHEPMRTDKNPRPEPPSTESKSDPFARIRGKSTLRSRAEQLIERDGNKH